MTLRPEFAEIVTRAASEYAEVISRPSATGRTVFSSLHQVISTVAEAQEYGAAITAAGIGGQPPVLHSTGITDLDKSQQAADNGVLILQLADNMGRDEAKRLAERLAYNVIGTGQAVVVLTGSADILGKFLEEHPVLAKRLPEEAVEETARQYAAFKLKAEQEQKRERISAEWREMKEDLDITVGRRVAVNKIASFGAKPDTRK